MAKNVYPRHCYDDNLHLKIPFFMWASFLIGLRHIIFLTPPGRYLFGYSAEIMGHWYFVVPDLLVLAVLVASGYRVPESGKLARKIWRHGREIMLFASLSSIALVAVLEHATLANPSTWRFQPVATSLLLDGAVVLYLMLSRLAKDVFLDFREAEGKPTDRNSQVISSPPDRPRTVRATAQPTIHVVGAFCLLLLAYHLIFRDYFPLPNGRMGHDYMLTLGGFLDGFLWYRNNGFITPPWFSPSFCGGQALFADPQSAFYSIPQFLTFIVDPLQAVYWSFLLFAALGFWGMYLFARHCLALERLPAFVAATVFMFNGFYAHRMIIGHYGYQAFMLVPLIAYLLLLKSPGSNLFSSRSLLPTLLAGVLIAYWFHSGLTTLMIPAGLAVVSLACIAEIRTRQELAKTFVFRGLIAAALAILLSASKLNANLTLMGNFARDYYPLPGISNPLDLLSFVFQSFFYTSEHVYQTVTPLWKNIQWAAMPHELAYGMTPVPITLCVIALGAYLLNRRHQHSAAKPANALPLAPAMILLVILLSPIALLYYSPEWNGFLKQIPIIGSTTSPFRWLIIFIPVIAATTAIACEYLGSLRQPLILVALIAIPALNALEGRDYYKQQDYDPAAVVAFFQAVQRGEAKPHIREIGDSQAADNSQLANGISPARCYNPLYGYRLEKLQTRPLVPGSIDTLTPGGTLNLRNPACLVFPTENQCQLWDAFTTEQTAEAHQFANYQPLPFERSKRQLVADWFTTITIITILVLLLLAGFLRFKRNHNERDPAKW